MDTRTVLEGYLRRAVNPSNDDLDVSAIDQFCLTLKKDPSRMSTARELLVNRIQSTNAKESLLALEALEECMESLGREFRSEINKFRFLNELIKMVSKKYNGEQTPREVSERILNILLTWTNKYEPCECDKIQEAYNLLASQGIQHRSQQNVIIRNPGGAGSQLRSATAGDDRSNQSADKREQKLRQLISSGKREDFEKANLLIQNFCRDEERRTQMKSRRLSELQKVAENTKLLDEMLDQYRGGSGGADLEPNSSDDDLAVLNEIYESCESAHPTIVRLAEETQHCEEMIEKIFEVNDALNQVLDKYRLKVLNQQPNVHGSGEPLLSAIPSSVGYVPNIVGPDTLDCLFDVSDADGTTGYNRGAANKAAAPPSSSSDRTNYKDILSDIFTASATDGAGTVKPLTSVTNPTSGILMPETVLAGVNRSSANATNVKDHLLEINSLLGGSNSQHQQGGVGMVLPQNARIIPGKPVPSVDTANQRPTSLVSPGTNGTITSKNGTTGVATAAATPPFGKSIPELDSIITGMKATLLSPPSVSSSSTGVKLDPESRTVEPNEQQPVSHPVEEDDPILVAPAQPVAIEQQQQPVKPELKALADIVIDLDAITPSKEPSRTVLDDKEGLQITLAFAADHPRPDVTVIVISTINQGRTGIPSFQFDASVRKPCKLRLLPPSGTSLPGTKPFRPPADGITQVLLLANPSGEPVDLTCILTYLVGDDPDPIKESIVMQAVPSVRD